MFRFFRLAWDAFKEFIILIVILVISLILISQNESQSVKKFRTFVFSTFAAVSSVFDDVFSISNLRSEVTYLRNRNAELMLETSKLREYAFTNDELNKSLKFRDTSSYQLLPAVVVLKSLNGVQVNFVLNKGSDEGVRQGLPVVTDAGLIGIVQTVASSYSVVRTLKNADLKLIVQDERSRMQGILRWNGSSLMITNLPKTADILIGDRILTSRFSSLVNLPITLGKVTKILNPKEGTMNDVVVVPTASIERSENVFVILNSSGSSFILPSQISSAVNQ